MVQSTREHPPATEQAPHAPMRDAEPLQAATRPWTPALAAEEVPSRPPHPQEAAPEPNRERGPWVMTVVALLAVVVAVAVAVISRVDLAGSAAIPLAVNGLSIETPSTEGRALAPDHFPATATSIVYTVAYAGASAGDDLVIRLEPPAGMDRIPDAHQIVPNDPGSHPVGTLRGQLVPTGATVAPGQYTLAVRHNGQLLREYRFTIDPPGGAMSAGSDAAATSRSTT